jgi:hypothetical protein
MHFRHTNQYKGRCDGYEAAPRGLQGDKIVEAEAERFAALTLAHRVEVHVSDIPLVCSTSS